MNIGEERRTIIIEPIEAPALEPDEPQPVPPQEAPAEPRPVEEPALVPNR
jgi:hypothetical protein